MRIRAFANSDLQTIIDLTIETFRPFHDSYVRRLLGDELFQHQDGRWEQDYREDLPTLHAPDARRHVAVAEIDGVIVGFVSWKAGEKPNHGHIYLLAVSDEHRREQVGSQLCVHAMEQMKADGIEAVEIGTGDDPFHFPARSLYERLGYTKIPTAAYVKML